MAKGTNNNARLLSGRVKKTPATSADPDRYKWLALDNAEPDLGIPSANGSVLTSTTDGNRSFANQITVDSGNVNFYGNYTFPKATGSSGTVLTSDGSGNVIWSAVSAIGGSNTQLIFNDSGSSNGSANLTFNKSTNNLALAGNLTNVNNITANFVAGTLTTAAQPNITSVGTLSSLAVTGNANAANFNGNHFGSGAGLSSITGANVTGTVANATYAVSAGSATTAGTVTTAAQPNITSIGNLTIANITTAVITTGNITTINSGLMQNGNSNVVITANGNVTISAVGGARITATSAGANVTGTLGVSGNANVGNIGATIGVFTGNISSLNANLGNFVQANYINVANDFAVGSGSGGNIIGANLISANFFTGTLTTAAQPNITSVGTLTSLIVSGNTVVGGNLLVNGNLTYINVEDLKIEDPIIVQGGGPDGNALTTNDGKDRGTQLQYYTTAPVSAFMGWDNSNAEFAFGSNVTITNEIAAFNSFGNVRASTFIGSLSGAATSATTAGTVTTAAQPNITSVGTLSSLVVTANVTAGNFIGTFANGNSNISIPAASGNINLSAGGTPNELVITSTGVNISGTLNATGNANVGNIGATNGVFTNVSGNGSALTSITGTNVTGTVANATYAVSAGSATTAGTVTTAAQPNITSVGTLSSLTVTANVTAGNVGANNGALSGSLSLTGTTSNLIFTNSTTGNLSTDGSYIGLSGTQLNIWNNETGNINFGIGSYARVLISSSGNVAISSPGYAVTEPQATLDISIGQSANTIKAALTSFSGDTDYRLSVLNGNTGINSANSELASIRMLYGSNSLNTGSGIGFYHGGAISQGAISLITSNSRRLTVSNTGNVGINTLTPGQFLTVNGGIQTNGPATLGAASSPGIMSFESPDVRMYIGDGTGYSYRFSKRASSTTTDLVTISDLGGSNLMILQGGIRLDGSTSGYVGIAPAAAAGSVTYTLPSVDGTANSVLVTNGSATLSWQTRPVTVQSLPPEAATYPATNFPQFKAVAGTNFPINTLAFDASTSETAYFRLVANDYSSGNLTVKLRWYADTATSGSVVWGVAIAAISPGDAVNMETKGFATEQLSANSTASSTTHGPVEATVTVSNLDSLASMDTVVFRVARKTAEAGDTMAGDAQLFNFIVEYAA